jgi:hypothetical protein
MLRDVLIASINKGQFPLAILGIVVVAMLLKMPGADVSRLVFDLLAGLKDGALLGYVIAGFALTGWFLHARWQRRVMTQEVNRVADERTKLQAQQLGESVESSQRK